MISLWSSPSKGSLPHSSRNMMTPTDQRSASFPYPCIVSTLEIRRGREREDEEYRENEEYREKEREDKAMLPFSIT